MSFNGIRAAGAGMLGRPRGAAASSWSYNPASLAARIRALSRHRAEVTVIEDDALFVLPTIRSVPRSVFYLDPPYSAQGMAAARLYPHWRLNRRRLMSVAEELPCAFLMSHQDAPVVRPLASQHGFAMAALLAPGLTTTELLIGRNLRWLRRTGRPFTMVSPGP